MPSDERYVGAIVIPSAGRADAQWTLADLPRSWRYWTFLAVPRREAERYRACVHVPVLEVPDSIARLRIGATRRWIMENAPAVGIGDRAILMLDDDLEFYERSPTSGDYWRMHGEALCPMLEWMVRMVRRGFVQAGLHPEYMCQGCPTEEHNTRVITAFAVNLDLANMHGIAFDDDLPLNSDIDFTLRALRKGLMTVRSGQWVYRQPPGKCKSGGCVAYRTEHLYDVTVERLRQRHPSFVVYDPNGARRLSIKWKRAFDSASTHHIPEGVTLSPSDSTTRARRGTSPRGGARKS